MAGTPARVLARRGRRVLALDSDTLPGLALSLGASAPDEPPLLAAAEKGDDGRWRLRRGIVPHAPSSATAVAAGTADAVVVVAQATAKSIDIAARAARMEAAHELGILVVANRVRVEGTSR